jgi:hypothetical protein
MESPSFQGKFSAYQNMGEKYRHHVNIQCTMEIPRLCSRHYDAVSPRITRYHIDNHKDQHNPTADPIDPHKYDAKLQDTSLIHGILYFDNYQQTLQFCEIRCKLQFMESCELYLMASPAENTSQ